jgi:hypothetical protein
MRFVWSDEMDRRLSDWLLERYGTRTPDPDQVSWREAASVLEGA